MCIRDRIENSVLSPDSRLHPDQTGLPNLFGIPLDSRGGLCLFAIGYEDRVLEICEGGFQVLREWEVNDVCSGREFVSYTQVITVMDTQEPEIVSGPDTITVSVDPWTCVYNGTLPFAEVAESCSSSEIEAYVLSLIHISEPTRPY